MLPRLVNKDLQNKILLFKRQNEIQQHKIRYEQTTVKVTETGLKYGVVFVLPTVTIFFSFMSQDPTVPIY